MVGISLFHASLPQHLVDFRHTWITNEVNGQALRLFVWLTTSQSFDSVSCNIVRAYFLAFAYKSSKGRCELRY